MKGWKPKHYKFWINLSRLLSYGKFYKKSIIFAIMLLWLAAAMEVSGPMLISYFIDNILLKRNPKIFVLTSLSLIFVALQILSSIIRYYQTLIFSDVSLKIIQRIRTEVMENILYQPLNIFDLNPVGQFISRLTNDTEAIKDLYITALSSILRSLALISAMQVAMFLLDWKLACISFILFPVFITVVSMYHRYSTPIVRKMRIYLADINNNFNEIINGMRVIQQFRQQQRFGDKLQKANFAHLKTRMETLKLESYLLRPLLSLLFSLTLCGILILFGLSNKGTIGVGILYAFINYLGRLNEPLIELTSQQTIIQQAVVSGERIFELIDAPIQKYGKDNSILKEGKIEFRNLEFSYDSRSEVLKHISLLVPSKSFVALVGRTGSGKSTLANLIMGFYPVNKEMIFLDNRPIETLSHYVLRNGIVMVQQDPSVMPETLYNNITLGRKISENKVWSALKKVKLDRFVRSLPEGLFTELGEHGEILSIGQKQLLILARALVFVPSILILDEATANIDSYTERIIVDTLQEIRNKSTIVVIAHRLSTVVKADQILVMHDGRIVERGKHEDLINHHGYYYNMNRLEKS